MAYDTSKFTKLGHLKSLAEKVKVITDELSTLAGQSIKSGELVDHVAKFYTSANKTGTPAFTMDIPEEMFLDQLKTKFVGKFAWSATEYPGSTNPNLDDKPVFVLAVKGEDDDANPSYSFLDMSALVDTYTAADKSVAISGYTVKVNLSAEAGNAIVLKEDGLYVAHQDISGKADKPTTAAEGNVAKFDANKNPVDAGFAAADVQQKLTNSTENNVRVSDANGFAKDSGIAISAFLQGSAASDAEVNEMLTEVFDAE